jgi:predicted HTH transcriptional regulator
VTPEKVTVENPGGFPPGVTPDMPFSKPRNPVLADLMYRVGMVEEVGGLRNGRWELRGFPSQGAPTIWKPR